MSQFKAGDRVVATERGFALGPGDTGKVSKVGTAKHRFDMPPETSLTVAMDSGVEMSWPAASFRLERKATQ